MHKRLHFAIPIFLTILILLNGRHVSAADAAPGWQPLLIARFGNIDAIDAEDGPLAAFLRNVRNDGRFPPPMKTLIGPKIRNPTFFGLAFEAWIECALLAPTRPGPVENVWVFPVDNRDEYMTQLANQGLTEYEGMDGVTVLREMDRDGNYRAWHLEWLPGNVAVFGTDRDAVAACRRLYAENSAARGMLAGSGGRYVLPDVMLSVRPDALAAWRDRDPAVYWWREKIDRLSRDLIDYWGANPARARLINSLAEDWAVWPRTVDKIDLSVWFEEDGVEWRLDAAGSTANEAVLSQLDIFRCLPERSALAYAAPVTPAAFRTLGDTAGRMLLGAAGGVVTAEARRAAIELFAALIAAAPTQMAAAWVPPPAGRPEMGGARLLVSDWERPEELDRAWQMFLNAAKPGTPTAQALSQIGWEAVVTPEPVVEGAAEIILYPSGTAMRTPYYDAAWVMRRSGKRMALAGGASRPDPAERRGVLDYRATLARDAAESGSAGAAPVREAFTRAGQRGASGIGFLDPVRFMQLALIEAADWRPRSPDQHEPLSTQLAKEMLEYASGGVWTMAAEADGRGWHMNGGMPWRSLARLAGALGITESIGME